MKLLATLLTLACLAACSPSTVFISSYRPPKAEPLDLKGERVAALVLMDDTEVRMRAEIALAREISRRGAVGVPMYQVLPHAGTGEGDARAAVEQAGVKGVIAMRPRRAQKQVVTPPSTYSLPMYNGFWGGYFPYAWDTTTWAAADGPYRTTHGPQEANPYIQDTIVDPGHVEIYDVVRVEILIYSLKQNQLVWAGESETEDPDHVETFVEELAEGTAEELRRLWLVPS